MTSRVAIVVVSHSKDIATGVRALAQEMAPDVHIGAAGGDPEGGLGTSFDLVEAVTREALLASENSGVVFLTDLGSAALTVETVIEFADEPDLLKAAIGPIVEGAVAAAVAAQQGEDLSQVARSVGDAAKQLCEEADPTKAPEETPDEAGDTGNTGDNADTGDRPTATVTATVVDETGLHARPAAKLSRLAASYEAKITINGVPAASVMEIMALGVRCGDQVTVSATGPGAQDAAVQIADAINAGFD